MPIQRLRQMFFPPEPAPMEARIFCVPEGVRVYAVGDIHGRANLLSKMMHAIAEDARANPKSRIIEIYLGDYIDRGLQSREVIDLLLAPPPAGHERICLMGNHEEALLHFLKDPNILKDWTNFGGYATLASYGIDIPSAMLPETRSKVRDQLQQNLPAEHLNFLKNLELTSVIGDYLFVHAGILPGVPLAQQKPQHLLWIRDSFLKHDGFFDQYYVVHGHSPTATPDIHINRAGIDVSEAAISSLCCLALEGGERNIIMATDE